MQCLCGKPSPGVKQTVAVCTNAESKRVRFESRKPQPSVYFVIRIKFVKKLVPWRLKAWYLLLLGCIVVMCQNA